MKRFSESIIARNSTWRGAALGGGVAGHAGLFRIHIIWAKCIKDADEWRQSWTEKDFVLETIRYFTGYHNPIGRRGYGFDKPTRRIIEKETGDYPVERYPSRQCLQPNLWPYRIYRHLRLGRSQYNILYIFFRIINESLLATTRAWAVWTSRGENSGCHL